MTKEQFDKKLAKLDSEIEAKQEAKKDLQKKLNEFRKNQRDSLIFLLGKAVLSEIERVSPDGFDINDLDRKEMKVYADRLSVFLKVQDDRGNWFIKALFPPPPEPERHQLDETEQARTNTFQQGYHSLNEQ